MISVDRNAVDENGTPIQPSDNWFTRAATKTQVAIDEGETHDVDEAFYKEATVRAALERLFHDKCAYCEWKPTGGSDWDVEHYRPKGKVFENEDHPGYYWLSYTWNNFYLSCTHCNQKRKDKPRWEDPTTLPSEGKHYQFPIADEADRAFSPDDDLSTEHTFLIDPCAEDPEAYLGFDAFGNILSIDDNIYGEETIRVFHLDRRRLKDLRYEKVVVAAETLKALIRAKGRGDTEAETDFRNLLDFFQASDRQFSAVARYVEQDPLAFGITIT